MYHVSTLYLTFMLVIKVIFMRGLVTNCIFLYTTRDIWKDDQFSQKLYKLMGIAPKKLKYYSDYKMNQVTFITFIFKWLPAESSVMKICVWVLKE